MTSAWSIRSAGAISHGPRVRAWHNARRPPGAPRPPLHNNNAHHRSDLLSHRDSGRAAVRNFQDRDPGPVQRHGGAAACTRDLAGSGRGGHAAASCASSICSACALSGGVYDRANMPILLTGPGIGVVVGTLIFGMVRQDVLRLVIGAIAIAFALNNLFGWAKNRPPTQTSWPRGVFWSSISGLTSFLRMPAGHRSWRICCRCASRRGSTSGRRCGSSSRRITPRSSPTLPGTAGHEQSLTALVLLPLVPVGVWLGVHDPGQDQRSRVLPDQLRALLGIGVKLVYDGITQV